VLQSAFADVAAVAHIRAIDPRADTDNVVGRGDTGASISAERDVIITSGVKCESPMTNGCVAVAGGVIPERIKADSGVGRAVVARQRETTDARNHLSSQSKLSRLSLYLSRSRW
jgi:hypothetical protein